jgi:hypothetical protein
MGATATLRGRSPSFGHLNHVRFSSNTFDTPAVLATGTEDAPGLAASSAWKVAEEVSFHWSNTREVDRPPRLRSGAVAPSEHIVPRHRERSDEQ